MPIIDSQEDLEHQIFQGLLASALSSSLGVGRRGDGTRLEGASMIRSGLLGMSQGGFGTLRIAAQGHGGPSLLLISMPGGGLLGTALPGAVSDDGDDDDLGTTLEALLMDQILQSAMERSAEQHGGAPPPANESVRDALPRVVVTIEDLVDSSNSRCVVCLEEYRPGFRATRMLCGHLFLHQLHQGVAPNSQQLSCLSLRACHGLRSL